MKNWRPWKTGILAAAGVFLLGSVSTVSHSRFAPKGSSAHRGPKHASLTRPAYPSTQPADHPAGHAPRGKAATTTKRSAQRLPDRGAAVPAADTADGRCKRCPDQVRQDDSLELRQRPRPEKGPKADATFNYPGYTIETRTNQIDRVLWVNDLVDDKGNYLPHLFPVDQTLHWANPPMDCKTGDPRTDCRGRQSVPYMARYPSSPTCTGPILTPSAMAIPSPGGYRRPRTFRPVTPSTAPITVRSCRLRRRGLVRVRQQPAGHDPVVPRSFPGHHPAERLRRSGGLLADPGRLEDSLGLPGPAPVLGETVADLNTPFNPVRNKIREIPIVIQDRSFNTDGSLFYPQNRAFFQEVPFDKLDVSFIPDTSYSNVPSDVSPIWNPEAFFNTMVVNGRTWPKMVVEPDLYRLRLLNGSNSRFLILKMVDGTRLRPIARSLRT